MIALPWGVRETIAAVLLGLSCGGSPAPQSQGEAKTEPAEVPEPVALRVSFAGCSEVRSGPECVFEAADPQLRLWAEIDPGFEAELRLDGVRVDARPVAVEGGLRWVVRPPATAGHLEVVVDLDGVPGRFMLALDSSPAQRPGLLDEIEAIEDRDGLTTARQELQARMFTFEGDDEVFARILEGDLAYREDDLPAVTAAYSKGFEVAMARGRLRDASTMAQRLSFLCLALLHDERCARQWLERDAPLVEIDPEQRMLHAYFEGLLAEQVGDLRAALEAHRSGEREARALGLVTLEAAALLQQMLLVGRLGAKARAQALEERALALEPELAIPLRSQVLNGVAWMDLQARGRGQPTQGDPEALLGRALSQLEGYEDAIAEDTRLAITLNQAYAAVLDERAPEARRWLEGVEETRLDHEDRLWRHLLLARVALLEGDPARARRRFATLLAEAERLYEPELRWQALLGQGQVHEAQGRPQAALMSYSAAERVLDEQLPRIAMGEGRARFVAERDHGTQRLVDLLLRLDRPAEALCRARLGRTRALRTLARQLRRATRASPDQQHALKRYRQTRARLEVAYDESWSLPAAAARQRQRELEHERRDNQQALDRILNELEPGEGPTPSCNDLPRPGPGGLDLHFVRLDEDWVGFAVDEGGIATQRLGPIALDTPHEPRAWPRLGEALLGPFAEPLARAKRVRVMPTGELSRVPFHALPAPGSPEHMLIDLVTVRYGLDLPGRTSTIPTTGTAIVIAPPSNLRHARAELDTVERLLTDTGWPVRRVEGDRARGELVRRALPEVDLMHYVGHARFDGIGGFSSALSLARDSSLEVSDVLALARAPSIVVLNGCETGRTDPQALAGGMSLAHAFVLAGADLVVATDQEVDDAAAAALVRAFYEAFGRGDGPAEALQTALQARRGLDEVWVKTRAWVP